MFRGEDFWRDIEQVIRQETVKFVYILSRTSNSKQGSLDELSVARAVQDQQHLRDFIIPVRIDDLPFSDINIELKRLNAIDFSAGWATGLKQLLQEFEADAVPRDATPGPAAVRQWCVEEQACQRSSTIGARME